MRVAFSMCFLTALQLQILNTPRHTGELSAMPPGGQDHGERAEQPQRGAAGAARSGAEQDLP